MAEKVRFAQRYYLSINSLLIVFGEVMAQWPHMFRILNLYSVYLFPTNLLLFSSNTVSNMNKQDSDDNNVTTGERLVRIPLDALQDVADKEGKP